MITDWFLVGFLVVAISMDFKNDCMMRINSWLNETILVLAMNKFDFVLHGLDGD